MRQETRLAITSKTREQLAEKLKVVDLVFELADARCPYTSRSPSVSKLIGHKKRVLVLNKSDLAESRLTAAWLAYFQSQGLSAVEFDSLQGRGMRRIREYLQQAETEMNNFLSNKGRAPRELRAAVFGIPNTGKSTFLNRLIGKRTMITGNRPGITRGPQWVHVVGKLSVLDTPGVFPPWLTGEERLFKLAVIGVLDQATYDSREVAARLLGLLAESHRDMLEALCGRSPQVWSLEQVALAKNLLLAGGQADIDRAAILLLNQVRGGKLGGLTLEKPERPLIVR